MRSIRPGRKTSGADDKRLPVEGLARVSEEVIYPHIFGNANREVGGVLVGRGSDGQNLPRITGAIPAISADEQRSTLTFTQDSWEHVHRVLEDDYPAGEQIVGWYHSHPGFGIFLSGHDLFIHNNFFTAPFQIAVVVDPLGCTDGTFVWKDGEVAKLYEYPTPDHWEATVDPRDLGQPASGGLADAPGRGSGIAPFKLVALALIVGLFIGLGVALLLSGGGGDNSEAEKRGAAAGSPRARAGTLDRKQADKLLQASVEQIEEVGGSAVLAFWDQSWSRPVIVGSLSESQMPMLGLVDLPAEKWDAGTAIRWAHNNIANLAPAAAGDSPFASWPTRSRATAETPIANGKVLTAQIGGLPSQFYYFAAFETPIRADGRQAVPAKPIAAAFATLDQALSIAPTATTGASGASGGTAEISSGTGAVTTAAGAERK